MRPIALISLLGFANTVLATCAPDCPRTTNLDDCEVDSSNTCLAPAIPLKKRSFSSTILRRTCTDCPPTECPEASKKCTPGGRKPPQLPATVVPFLCGQKLTDKSVTVTYIDCATTTATQKCLYFLLSPGMEAPKLEISSKPLTASNSGKFTYFKPTNYCDATSCTVPIDVILGREGKTPNDICDLTLYITIHSGLGGDTCWPKGSPIADNNGNWAEAFSITFECPTYPEKCCCCPSAPPPPPAKKCEPETAYASAAGITGDLQVLGCSQSWGYYQTVSAGQVNGLSVGATVYTADLLAGKTIDVGQVTVKKTSATASDTCFRVTLSPDAGFGVGKVHVEISCKNPKENLGDRCRTPGKYEFKTGCLEGGEYTTAQEVCSGGLCTGGSYYFLVHAETYSVVEYDAGNPGPYDQCKAYTCTA